VPRGTHEGARPAVARRRSIGPRGASVPAPAAVVDVGAQVEAHHATTAVLAREAGRGPEVHWGDGNIGSVRGIPDIHRIGSVGRIDTVKHIGSVLDLGGVEHIGSVRGCLGILGHIPEGEGHVGEDLNIRRER
jgi:hypothetical protein